MISLISQERPPTRFIKFALDAEIYDPFFDSVSLTKKTKETKLTK
jgi:hypothetical protein